MSRWLLLKKSFLREAQAALAAWHTPQEHRLGVTIVTGSQFCGHGHGWLSQWFFYWLSETTIRRWELMGLSGKCGWYWQSAENEVDRAVTNLEKQIWDYLLDICPLAICSN